MKVLMINFQGNGAASTQFHCAFFRGLLKRGTQPQRGQLIGRGAINVHTVKHFVPIYHLDCETPWGKQGI